ncbi:MAG: cupin domain-containing protein [Parafilimonas sp.]
MHDAAFYIEQLNLKPHPEGGYYKETYRSKGIIPVASLKNFTGDRNYSTAIYYLLQQGNFSAFHKIKSDECWHHYAGNTLLIHVLYNNADYRCIKLGAAIDKDEVLQFIVPANTWFAAECAEKTSFVLAGCTVAPGFDFADFEMADKQNLLHEFPLHKKIISGLCK